MTSALRFAFVATFVAGISFAVPHVASAQNVDEAHALCAQGGGDSSLSGAGGPNLADGDSAARAAALASADGSGDGQQAEVDPDSGASGGAGGAGGGDGGGSGAGDVPAVTHAGDTPSSDNAAGAGGIGSGGGLGGSAAGGGAGGCGAEGQAVVRRLPVTGSNSDRVACMGGAFVACGVALVLARRRLSRRAAGADDFVWDVFRAGAY
jgi:hypothetical protein